MDDDTLIGFISEGQKSISFFCPGLSVRVAEALAQKWVELGPDSLSIVLNIEPEACRAGFGVIQAVEMLQEIASRLKRTIYHRPGLRVGLLVTESTTVVFAPVPMLIEAESTDFPRPNALCLRGISDQPSSLKTLEHVGKEAEDLKQGSEPVTAEKLDQVSKDLASNSPLKFDLARVVRTFNAQFQFVEFEVTGLQLNRMTVPIPSDLMGLARDEQMQKLLHSTFKLVRDNCEVSGEKIVRAKKKIAEKYLVSLKGLAGHVRSLL